jgi:hypothetical protein
MILNGNSLYELLKNHTHDFHQVVKFNPVNEKLISFDFTKNNPELKNINTQNVEELSKYVFDKLKMQHAILGFGGYNELRVLYNRSDLFNNNLFVEATPQSIEEPRRLHIGIDIWGHVGTEVFAPLGGMVHSFAFNNHPGDYGATIILLHQLEGIPFFTLYGHVSMRDIESLKEGGYISRGQKLAHFGKPEENGHWPPHLHFQIIKDITPYIGDYPGVCKISERKKYLQNSPDPDVILNLQKFIG